MPNYIFPHSPRTSMNEPNNLPINIDGQRAIHADLKDLLWFADGPYKNYIIPDDYYYIDDFDSEEIDDEFIYDYAYIDITMPFLSQIH